MERGLSFFTVDVITSTNNIFSILLRALPQLLGVLEIVFVLHFFARDRSLELVLILPAGLIARSLNEKKRSSVGLQTLT